MLLHKGCEASAQTAACSCLPASCAACGNQLQAWACRGHLEEHSMS